MASWKSCQSPPWSMGLASKGPSLPLPQAWSSSWLPLFWFLAARVRVFGVGVEVEKKEFKLDQKNAFFMLSACSGASGAGQALARRQPSDFWRLQALVRRWPGAGQTSFGKTAIATSSTVGLS